MPVTRAAGADEAGDFDSVRGTSDSV